jgi:hypothetical protein
LLHERRGGPGGEHRAPEVHPEQEVELLAPGERRSPAGEDVRPGIVHPHIHPAHRVTGAVGEPLEMVLLRDVGLDDGDPAAQPADLRGDLADPPLVLAVGQGELGAGARRGGRDGATDAAGGAGHDHPLAGEGERRRCGVVGSHGSA